MRWVGSLVITGALLVSAGGEAVAEDTERWQPRREIGFGLAAGGGDVFAGVGPRVEAGLELGGQLHLLGAYEYLSGASDFDQDGISQRIGVRVQHPLLSFGGERFRSSVLVSAGAGWQRVHWDDGDGLSRGDAALGFVWSYDLYWAGTERWRMSSMRMGFSWRIADMPDMPGIAGCDGPCTSRTAHRAVDSQFLVTLTFTAGKW
jgi:hypothetical protein